MNKTSRLFRCLREQEECQMKYEKPEVVRIVADEKNDTAMGPDGCSTKWSGCCYKD